MQNAFFRFSRPFLVCFFSFLSLLPPSFHGPFLPQTGGGQHTALRPTNVISKKKKIRFRMRAFHRIFVLVVLNRVAFDSGPFYQTHILLEASQDGNFCVGKAEIASCEASSKVCVMGIE